MCCLEKNILFLLCPEKNILALGLWEKKIYFSIGRKSWGKNPASPPPPENEMVGP